MRMSLKRKVALRDDAAARARAARKAESLGRTTQVAHSTVVVGDGDVAVDELLAGSADLAVVVDEHADDLTLLDDAAGLDVDAWLDQQEQADADSDDAHAARMAGIEVLPEVESAQAAADQAAADALSAQTLAEGLYQVIPSETEPTTGVGGVPLKQGDQWWVVGTGPNAGKFVGVKVYNGTAWQDRQLVADSVLVPGSVGNVLIKDGGVTAEKMAADFYYGRAFYGGLFDGGEFRISDAAGWTQLFYNNVPSLTGWSSAGTLSLSTTRRTGSYSATANQDFGLTISSPPTALSATVVGVWMYSTVAKSDAFVFVGHEGGGFTIREGVSLPATTWTYAEVQVAPGVKPSSVAFPANVLVDSVEVKNAGESPSKVRLYRDPDGKATVESSTPTSTTILRDGELLTTVAGVNAIRVTKDGVQTWDGTRWLKEVTQSGSYNFSSSVAAGANADSGTIAFPTEFVASAPVTLNWVGSTNGILAYVANQSAAGFVIRLRNVAASAITPGTVRWYATGKVPA